MNGDKADTLGMLSYPFNFSKLQGTFLKRLNRFVLEVELNARKEQAYLANPGRLWELLLPGTKLLLSPTLSNGKLPYNVLACRKDNNNVLLHTHLTNKVVSGLIKEDKLPAFTEYRVEKEEPRCGKHRFDLLLIHKETGYPFYLEIKSCTLFAGKIAMFPDAVTARGTNHLYKLKELSDSGIKTGCLFVIMNPQVEYFLPAYHIDINFADAFKEVKNHVQVGAISLGFDRELNEVTSVTPAAIPYNLLQTEVCDRGIYLLMLKIDSDKTIRVGELGEKQFKQGYYVYVGSAMQALSKRIARHGRKRKKNYWHIDYLTAEAAKVTPVPIVTGDSLECDLAAHIKEVAENQVKGFGSSDCKCAGHLYYFRENPLHNRRFIDIIQYYRIARLKGKLPG